jgi:hypothetical protein
MSESKPRVNLGWLNNWYTNPPQIYKECKEKGHKHNEKNLDPSNRGNDHLYWCDICGFEYHVDSSD